jgi:cardiolipin synthase
MPTLKKRSGVQLVPPPTRRLSVVQIIERVIALIAALQALVVTALIVMYKLRRQHMHKHGFPHIPLEEAQVGENRLQVYCHGQDLYDAMQEAIKGAKESIYLESYIWKDDAAGQQFKQLLAQKAAEGIAVYAIYDVFGNLVVPRSFYKSFSPKIHLLGYQSIQRPWQALDPRRYALDHRKLLVVDGSIGFIGGYNIGSLYESEWRDTHLRIKGPAAANLAHSFIDFWNSFCPPGQAIQQRHARLFDPLITVHGNDALHLAFPIRDVYIEAIDRADQSILLTNAYFIPDHMLLNRLKMAARRGVDVRVLLPWPSNHVVADWVSHSYLIECLEAGIRIFGYTHTMIHAKTCTIDGEWSTIGTANIDRLSSIGNYEINVEIYSRELPAQMRALFECDTADAFEVTLDYWKKRPLYMKASERLLSPLRFML